MIKANNLIDDLKLQTFKSTTIYGMLVFVFFVLVNIFIHNNFTVAGLNLFSAVVLLTILLLIIKKKTYWASFFFFIIMPTVLLVFDIVLGNVGASFYHFSFIVLASFLINNKKIFYVITFYSTICLALYFLLNIEPIFPELGKQLHMYNIFGSVICIILIAAVYKNESNNQILRISAQNTELQKQQNFQELLLKELNHRIKNNLQQISSILKFETSNSLNLETKEALIKTRNRVYTLAIIYKKLYNSDFNKEVSIKSYLLELIENISDSYEIDLISFKLNIDDLKLDMQDCINIGLIINELITNSLKYSMKSLNDLKIEINLKTINKREISVKLKDNGKGFGELEAMNENGLKLIKLLLSKNEGSIELSTNQGANIDILYPINHGI